MPNRLIREGWVESEAVHSLSAEAERFFLRLCLKADDFGRFHAHLSLLKSHLFPLWESLRSTDIAAWLADCEKAGLVRCYEAQGKPYVEIPKFRQRTRATESKFPPPPWPTDHPRMPGTRQTHDRRVTDTRPASAHVGGDGDGDAGGGGGAGGPQRPPKRLHNIPNSVEEVIAYGKTLNPPMSEDRSTAFWNHYEAQARTNADGDTYWVTGSETVITNWKAKLPQFAQPLQGAPGTDKPNPRNAATFGNTSDQGRRIAEKIAKQGRDRSNE